MATSVEYIEHIIEQINMPGAARYRKMFGEYMVYINDKPILLVCDNTVYVKMLPELASLLENADTGIPYGGAKEHYILDTDDRETLSAAIKILEEVTPLPKKRAKKA